MSEDITYKLPSIYGGKTEERLEKSLAESLLPKYLLLRLLGLKNTGKRTAILCSNTDGFCHYNEATHLQNVLVGTSYQVVFEKKFGANAELITGATSQDLRAVIRDKRFANIFLIGHANHHVWCASDKAVSWGDLGNMVDEHLKDGIFATVGCGAIISWNRIPLGYFVVADHKQLFGYEAAWVDYDEMMDITKLRQLKEVPSLESVC